MVCNREYIVTVLMQRVTQAPPIGRLTDGPFEVDLTDLTLLAFTDVTLGPSTIPSAVVTYPILEFQDAPRGPQEDSQEAPKRQNS